MPKTYQKYQYLLKRKSPKTNDIARFDILNSRIRDFSIFFCHEQHQLKISVSNSGNMLQLKNGI